MSVRAPVGDGFLVVAIVGAAGAGEVLGVADIDGGMGGAEFGVGVGLGEFGDLAFGEFLADGAAQGGAGGAAVAEEMRIIGAEVAVAVEAVDVGVVDDAGGRGVDEGFEVAGGVEDVVLGERDDAAGGGAEAFEDLTVERAMARGAGAHDADQLAGNGGAEFRETEALERGGDAVVRIVDDAEGGGHRPGTTSTCRRGSAAGTRVSGRPSSRRTRLQPCAMALAL